MLHPRDLRRIHDAVQPRSALIEAEGEIPASFELHLDARDIDAPLPRFECEGYLRETPSRFESSGELRFDRSGPEELHEIRLVENITDEGKEYAVEGKHRVPASSTTAAVVSSTESIKKLVSNLLARFSERLGSLVEAEVETHHFNREERVPTAVVEAEYTVRLIGLGKFTGARRRHLRVKKAELTVSRGDELTCVWETDLRNHGSLFTDSSTLDGFDAHAVRTARRRSDFCLSLDWRARSSQDDILLEMKYDTENTARYVEELNRRGFEIPARTSFDFELDTRGSTTATSFEYETEGDPEASFRKRFAAWLSFLPLPVPFVLLRR